MKPVRAPRGRSTARRGLTVLLLRHADTDAASVRLAGRTLDIGLNARGVAAAARVASELADRPVSAVYSSPRRRARETAAPLAAVLATSITIDDAFDEVDFGEWSGVTFTELASRDDWRRYNAQRAIAIVPGGEMPADTLTRITTGLMALHDRHGHGVVVVVTHAEVVRYALLAARQQSLDQWPTIDVAPATVVTLTCHGAHLAEAACAQLPA